MAETEIVSKSEAARRFGVSPAQVTKDLRRGMPQLTGGGLDWEKVSRWREENVVPQKSGNYRQRNAKAAIPAQLLGTEIGYVMARAKLRDYMPELLSTVPTPKRDDAIAIFAMVDHLLSGWLDTPLNSQLDNEPIDWTSHAQPGHAHGVFDGFKEFLSDGDKPAKGRRRK